MAENETLNLCDRYSGRWQALMKLITQQPSVDQVGKEAVRCLYSLVKSLYGLLPIADLLAAAAGENGPVAEVVARCPRGRDYAQLVELQAGRGLSKEGIVTNVLTTTLETFSDQISLRLGSESGPWTFSSCQRFMKEVMDRSRDDIRSLAAKIAAKPSEVPRMPALTAAERVEKDRQLTNMSLLGR